DCSLVHVIDEDERALTLSDERIEQAIIKMGARMFVLDPLQGYLGGADMHTANGVRPLMKQLASVAERTGCAIVIIGHLNKKGGKSQYRGLGSIDIYAAARSVLTVGRIGLDDDMRAVVHNKSNLSPAGSPVAFGLDPISGFVWLGDYDITIDELLNNKQTAPDSQFAKARRLIENALERGAVPAADMEQLAEEQGISQKTLNRAKSALGVISVKRGEKWYWELPINVEYTEVIHEDGQDSQDGHDSHMTSLTILPHGRGAI
ncbi:MAG: AAA family ATPase, partial [Chitinispirillales bacterium]|nr:AAA family ATPase [Chitinispirillales bacterium]